MKLSAELFNQIVAALKSDGADPHAHRHEPRVGLAAEVTLVNTTGPGPRVSKVKVRNISRTGLGLFHCQHMLKGQKFILLLQGSGDKTIWMVCSAAYCRKVDDCRYSIGAHVVQLLKPEQVKHIQLTSGVTMNLDEIVDVARASDAILA